MLTTMVHGWRGRLVKAWMAAGCAAALAGCVEMQHKISDAVATKVTAKVQARNAEAGALRSTLIVMDANERSQHVALALESAMNGLRVDEKPFYSNVKLGARAVGGLTEAQLVAEARSQGFGFNRGLLFPGSWGIGMAVRDAQDRPDFCLSLAAIESRMQPDRLPRLIDLLRSEVERLEARLKDFAAGRETRTATAPMAPAAARRINERK